MAGTIRPVNYSRFKGVAMDPTTYQIADRTDSRKLTEFLCQEGQFLLPLVELITGTETASHICGTNAIVFSSPT